MHFYSCQEQTWTNDCPEGFKPVYYRRYIDDIFALFRLPDHLEKFRNYLNSKHNVYSAHFHIKIREWFKTPVYRKLIFSGVYSNFSSFIYDQYKIGLIFTLSFRTFSIVSDFSRFHMKVIHLKFMLRINAFPIKLIDNCIINFLNKKFLHTSVTLTVDERELFIVVPYLSNLFLAIRTHLQNRINRNLPFCTIKVILLRLFINFSRFKDKVPFNLCSNVVYKYLCGRCSATYYGKTCQHLNIRIGDHSGVSSLTGKSPKLKTACSFAIM